MKYEDKKKQLTSSFFSVIFSSKYEDKKKQVQTTECTKTERSKWSVASFCLRKFGFFIDLFTEHVTCFFCNSETKGFRASRPLANERAASKIYPKVKISFFSKMSLTSFCLLTAELYIKVEPCNYQLYTMYVIYKRPTGHS